MRRIEEQRQFDLPGLSHKTVAGAVDHGHKEVKFHLVSNFQGVANDSALKLEKLLVQQEHLLLLYFNLLVMHQTMPDLTQRARLSFLFLIYCCLQVEAWRETIAPGGHMPIHRHELEEIFIILKGGGTVYVAPGPGQSENNFPGEPEATPFSSNSTISIPWNSAHQVGNVYSTLLFFPWSVLCFF